MKSSLAKLALSLVLGSALTGAAFAVPIIGEINLSGLGPVTLINNVGAPGAANPNNADGVNFPAGSNSFVTAASGTFTGFGGSLGHMADFAFNPGLSPMPVAPLWLLTAGPGAGFSFTLNAITLVDQATPNFLNLTGMGSFSGPAGFDTTLGTWAFTVTTQGSLFTWTSANIANAPDGGTTALLLGLGLLGLGAARRFMAR
jgi:hypothetical protein